MKQLYYAFLYMVRGKGNNVIKVISLTIGMIVSVVLFSQVAFEMSYDNFFPEKENLYVLGMRWTIQDEDKGENYVVNSPYGPTMHYEFEEVESAAVMMGRPNEQTFKLGENRFPVKQITVDSLFFSTMGFPLLVNNPDLMVPGGVLLSQSFARRVYGEEDPVGKTIMKDNNAFTIAGVFADIPPNCHLQFEVAQLFRPSLTNWQRNDTYRAYIRLRPGTDFRLVEAKIPDMVKRHYDVEAEKKEGIVKAFSLNPVVKFHSGNKEVRRTCLILSLLAFALLFAAAMNYILISISSLAKRAKAVGIHKCNGAVNRSIFAMFLSETLYLTLISLLLSLFTLLLFRSRIETLIKADFSAIFTLSNLWVVLAILVVLFLATGVIPARIFSSIPVVQVFRSYSDNKKKWKQSLLFAQFSGISFIITLLVIIIAQYQMMLFKDLGYSKENLLYTQRLNMTDEQLQTVKEEFLRFPEVSSAGLSCEVPITWPSGDPVRDAQTKESLFTGLFFTMDESFIDTYRMQIIAGRNLTRQSNLSKEAVVNETFVRRLNLKEPIGEKFFYIGSVRTICGVVKDFQYQSFYQDVPPIILLPDSTHQWFPANRLSLSLNVPLTAGLADKLSAKLKELSNDREAAFIPYVETYNNYYKDAYSFRNAVAAASALMLVITMLGLLGFVDDEINRRRKEIAIRKINGAMVADILRLLSKGIAYVAIPAILLGLMFSYIVGAEWLQQFAVKVPLNAVLFTLCGMSVLGTLLFCVVTRAWHTANENPVHSIKSE